MKKIFRLVCLAMMVLLLLSGCDFEAIETYRYADNWDNKIVFEWFDGTPVDKEKSKELKSLLKECKQMIYKTSLQQEFPYWNWKKLKNLKNIYSSSGIKLENGNNLNSGIYAKYFVTLNEVAILPDSSFVTKQTLKGFIIHELIHCLTYDPQKNIKYSQILEGVADFYALKVCEQYNIQYSIVYLQETWVLTQLFNIFGEEIAMKAIINGNLNSKIDSLTKPGMGQKVQEALTVLVNADTLYPDCSAQAMDAMTRVLQDIIGHCIKNATCTEKKEMIDFYKNHLIIKENYFYSILC